MPLLSAKFRKDRKRPKAPKKALDKVFATKKQRGRPPKVRASEIRGRADNYRYIFNQVWDVLWPLFRNAQNEEEVDRAFQEGATTYYKRTDVWPPSLLLRIKRDSKFPKRRDAQVKFFADSLAAFGDVSPRRSRDICARERAKEKRAHEILRFEFYIECSCKFKGRSRDHACPKCGTKIEFPWRSSFPF